MVALLVLAELRIALPAWLFGDSITCIPNSLNQIVEILRVVVFFFFLTDILPATVTPPVPQAR